MRRYRLKRKFGNLFTEKTIISWNPGYGHYMNNDFVFNHSECISFTQEEIDRNPSWFEEIKEEPKEFVWDRKSVEEMIWDTWGHADVRFQMDKFIKSKQSPSNKYNSSEWITRPMSKEELICPPMTVNESPKEQKKERVEVKEMFDLNNIYQPQCVRTGFVTSHPIPEEKFPLIKETIERVLNDEYHNLNLTFLQKAREDAFNAARSNHDPLFVQDPDWQYPTFNDYITHLNSIKEKVNKL